MRYLLPRLLLSISVFIGLTASLEVGLRWTGYGPPCRDGTSCRGAQVLIDDPASYRLHPTRIYELSKDYRQSKTHVGRYARGAWPFRGRPPNPSPDGIERIAVIGDSVVYGTNIDVADTLPERIHQELIVRGRDRRDVQVLNLGVPGYTTVQIRNLVEEVIATLAPRTIVLYAAAWNDQTPSLGASDRELTRHRDEAGWVQRGIKRTAIYTALRSWVRPSGRGELQRVMETWKRTGSPFIPRVSSGEVEEEIGAIADACQLAGVKLLVVVPAHPSRTLTRHPRTAEDAATVKRVALQRGLAIIDAPKLFASASDGGRTCFTDFVHLSPTGTARLARSIADELNRCSGPVIHSRTANRLAIRSFKPTSSSAFGDVEMTLDLSGWSSDEPLPVVLVGGAPLHHLRILSRHRVAGTLIANTAGIHHVVVQSSQGQAVAATKMCLSAPRLLVSASGRVQLQGRDGDRAIVFVATGTLHELSWSFRGAQRLDTRTRVALPDFLHSGTGGIQIPSSMITPGARLFLQPLVIPRGEPDSSPMARLGEVLAVKF